jgi:hypothetical protein
MDKEKPMTELRKLLGLPSNKELARFLNLKEDAVNNLNTGRGSENHIKAYQYLCAAMKSIPADKRRMIFQPAPRSKTTLSQKHHRKIFLTENLPKRIEKAWMKIDEAMDSLSEASSMYAEYEELIKE